MEADGSKIEIRRFLMNKDIDKCSSTPNAVCPHSFAANTVDEDGLHEECGVFGI